MVAEENAAFALSRTRVREVDLNVAPQVVLAHTPKVAGHPIRDEYRLAAERYQLLSTRVLQVGRTLGSRVFLVTSAIPNEGKTLTVTNLAFGLSCIGNKRVLLVEFDLRRPSMHRLLGINPEPGDGSFLARSIDWRRGLMRLRKGLDALLASNPCEQAHELLRSEATEIFLEQARREYDFVLLDSAPMLVAGDTHVLLPLVDQAIFVVRSGVSPIECAKEASDALGKKMLGCVFNDLKDLQHQEYYKGYYISAGSRA